MIRKKWVAGAAMQVERRVTGIPEFELELIQGMRKQMGAIHSLRTEVNAIEDVRAARKVAEAGVSLLRISSIVHDVLGSALDAT